MDRAVPSAINPNKIAPGHRDPPAQHSTILQLQDEDQANEEQRDAIGNDDGDVTRDDSVEDPESHAHREQGKHPDGNVVRGP